MLPMPVTALPGNAEAMADSVNLSEHRGRVVEIVTASGSTYWVVPLATRTTFRRRGVTCVRGLSITTNSETVNRFPTDPTALEAVNTVRTGQPWRFGDKGTTSNVRSVRVL